MKPVLTASILALLGAAASLAAPTPVRHETFGERYGMLSEHNIFSKDRPVVPATQPKGPPPAAVHTAEELLVLRGTLQDDDGYHAYVEDLNNSNILRLAPGDPVGRGRVGDIAIDSMEYQHDGNDDWIPVGADMTGRQVIPITSDLTGGGPTTGPAEIIDPNDPNLTTEQRMKLRRAHPELQK